MAPPWTLKGFHLSRIDLGLPPPVLVSPDLGRTGTNLFQPQLEPHAMQAFCRHIIVLLLVR